MNIKRNGGKKNKRKREMFYYKKICWFKEIINSNNGKIAQCLIAIFNNDLHVLKA